MRKVVFDIETRNFSRATENMDISIVGIYDSGTDSYSTFLAEELSHLWPILERTDLLIGFYSENFDLPLLNKYYPGDLSQIRHIDLLKEIKRQYGRSMKLDQLAEGTLGKKKSGHGLEAIKWWRTGEIDKIRAYCTDDVRLTKELYDHALEHKKLVFKEGPQMKEITLDVSDWDKPGENKLTFSLPF